MIKSACLKCLILHCGFYGTDLVLGRRTSASSFFCFVRGFFKADACNVTGIEAKHIQKKLLANSNFQEPVH